MGRQVMRWDEKVHQDILLAIFQHVKFTSDQMGPIMSDLTGIGYTFSESALRQHIQKLRREQGSPEKAAAKNGDDTPEPATPTKATPRKRKTPTTKKAKSAATMERSDDEGDDLPIKNEAEEPLTPKRAKKAKIEHDGP